MRMSGVRIAILNLGGKEFVRVVLTIVWLGLAFSAAVAAWNAEGPVLRVIMGIGAICGVAAALLMAFGRHRFTDKRG
jgi:hypothetical protein